jgi:hypothetical protein
MGQPIDRQRNQRPTGESSPGLRRVFGGLVDLIKAAGRLVAAGIKRTTLLVARALLDLGDWKRGCFGERDGQRLSLVEMHTGLSRRAIQRAIARLIDAGVLLRTWRAPIGTGCVYTWSDAILPRAAAPAPAELEPAKPAARAADVPIFAPDELAAVERFVPVWQHLRGASAPVTGAPAQTIGRLVLALERRGASRQDAPRLVARAYLACDGFGDGRLAAAHYPLRWIVQHAAEVERRAVYLLSKRQRAGPEPAPPDAASHRASADAARAALGLPPLRPLRPAPT